MAKTRKAAAPPEQENLPEDPAKLMEEAMGEIERLTARCFELEKIAGYMGSLADLPHLLWEVKTVRLMVDPEPHESVWAALQRRRKEDKPETEEADKLLTDAMVELERLTAAREADPKEEGEYEAALERVKDGLADAASTAMRAAIEDHTSPVREVWGRLSPFDQLRVVRLAQVALDEAVEELEVGG